MSEFLAHEHWSFEIIWTILCLVNITKQVESNWIVVNHDAACLSISTQNRFQLWTNISQQTKPASSGTRTRPLNASPSILELLSITFQSSSHFKTWNVSFSLEESHFSLRSVYGYLTWSLWVMHQDMCAWMSNLSPFLVIDTSYPTLCSNYPVQYELKLSLPFHQKTSHWVPKLWIQQLVDE